MSVLTIFKAENYHLVEKFTMHCEANNIEEIYAVEYDDGSYSIFNTLHGHRDDVHSKAEVEAYEE